MLTQILFGSKRQFCDLIDVPDRTRFNSQLPEQFAIIRRILSKAHGLVQFIDLQLLKSRPIQCLQFFFPIDHPALNNRDCLKEVGHHKNDSVIGYLVSGGIQSVG